MVNQQTWILASKFFGRGVASLDAGVKPWTYSRRPLAENFGAKSRMVRKTEFQEFSVSLLPCGLFQSPANYHKLPLTPNRLKIAGRIDVVSTSALESEGENPSPYIKSVP